MIRHDNQCTDGTPFRKMTAHGSSTPPADGGVDKGVQAAEVEGDARPRPLTRIQRIALVAVDHLDRDALCYVLNACQRMDARLDLLTGLPPEEVDRAVAEARAGKDTPWRLVPLEDLDPGTIERYMQDHSGLLFLASGDGDEGARRLRDGMGPYGARPGIPWVVVENKPRHP